MAKEKKPAASAAFEQASPSTTKEQARTNIRPTRADGSERRAYELMCLVGNAQSAEHV
jgi:hypothetical protein